MIQSLNNNQSQKNASPLVNKKNWYKKWWGVLIIIIVLYLLVMAVLVIAGQGFSSDDTVSLIGQERISDEILYQHTDNDPSWGSPDAPVQIIEFSDFQCPYCQESFPIIREALFKYQDQVYFLYRDFPDLINHSQAQKAAEAANCAMEQERFWPMHDKLFINQDDLSVEALKRYALEIGLNQPEFETCLSSGKYQQEIHEDYQDGAALGIIGTPTFFINGYKVSGSLPREIFLQIVEVALANRLID